jgi:DNA-binding transcriptional ArsR family regulator
MSDSDLDLASIESKLRGKTLLVYWYLLRSPKSSFGAREVQRALGFSSPSLAMHHLNKLQELGLVKKNDFGEYMLVHEIKIGTLKFFTRIGRYLVPRFLFYSIFFSTMLLTYLFLYGFSFNDVHNILAITFGGIASIIFWFETVKLLKDNPF